MTTIFLILFNVSSENKEVFICISKTASKYHLVQNCKGLSRCTHEIKKVNKSDATKMGYNLCGWEN